MNKTRRNLPFIGIISPILATGLTAVISLMSAGLTQAQQYVDVDGTTPGFGNYVYTSGPNGSGGMYDFSAAIFTTNAAGTSATTNFVGGSSLIYDATTTTGNFAVRLPGSNNPNTNFSLAGLSLVNNTGNYTLAFNNGFFYENTLLFSGGTINVSNGQIRINDRNNIQGNYVKTGTGSLQLNGRANGFGSTTAYSGTATISAGSILISSNVATGANSNYNLAGGGLQFSLSDVNPLNTVTLGVLGGTGTIASTTVLSLNIAAGGLTPGTNGTAGTLALDLNNVANNVFDLSGVGAVSLKFDLGATSDLVTLDAGGTLNIGTLNFTEFSFTNTGGLTAGTYTLFDTNAAITGSIGDAGGAIDASFNGTLSVVGQDVVLTVAAVPEPGACALILFGGMAVLLKRKRHTQI